MQNALHLNTTVRPGGRIEVSEQAFPAGEEVEVIVLLPASPTAIGRSVVDILAEAPGHRLFKTVADVDEYLQQERAAWDR